MPTTPKRRTTSKSDPPRRSSASSATSANDASAAPSLPVGEAAPPGGATIESVARAAGVSRATAGFVLADQAERRGIAPATARRVRETAERLRYVPNAMARNLRRRRSGVVGVVFAHLLHHWADRALRGMRAVLDPAGQIPFLTTHQFDPDYQDRELRTLAALQAEALICVPLAGSADTYRRLMERGTPLVLLGDTLEDLPEASYVAWDAVSAARAAVGRLVAMGRRRVAVIAWDYPRPLVRRRVDAWRDALREAGLPAREDRVAWVGLEADVDGAIERLWRHRADAPDALLATLDSHGVQALAALERRGWRVPEDVAIIGMGDHPGSGFPGVGLSTMAMPGEEIGREAARLALELRDHPDQPPAHRLIEFNHLIERRTTLGADSAGE